jgi:hypothetical protein
MLIGPTRRLTFATFLLAALLLAPAALAKPPAPNRDAPDSTGGQDLTDLDIDPTGRFVTAVVTFDNAKTLSGAGGLLPGSGGATHKDIYVCDFGPASVPRGGAGCRGVNHPSASGNTNQAQSVDVASYTAGTAFTPVHAVGGPGDGLSFWYHSSDTPRFTRSLGNPVTNVSVSPDGARVVATVTPTTVNAAGRLHVFAASDGEAKWDVDLTDSQGAAARPTSLAFSGDGRLLVVGTTRGFLFIDPLGPKPANARAMNPIDTNTPVSKVVVSRTGNALVVGTGDGIFYVPLTGYRPTAGATWNRGVTEGVSDVAMSLDGERFAAATGNRIIFYRHLADPMLVVEQLPDVYDAGARVNDLAYTGTGSLLVAVAGENVLGFGPAKSAPIWSFKATEAGRGALDLPLRKVALSETGERIVVAGRTKFMAYSNLVAATASFGGAGPVAVAPARPLATAFTVTNAGSLPDNYTFVVRAPVGWTATSPENVALDPDASAAVNLTVEAPAGTAPGLYPLTVDLRSRSTDNALVATAFLNLTIPRAVTLAVESADDRVVLPQGGEETLTFTVRNLGNAEGVVNMSATQGVTGASWTLRWSQEQVRIPAGASADVDLVLIAPSQGASGARNVITVRAREGEVEAVRVVTAYVDARFGAEVVAANESLEFSPGESRTLSVTIRNAGNTEDTFNVTYSLSPAIAANDWKITLPDDLKVTLSIRPAVAEPREASLTLHAVSQGSPNLAESQDSVLLTSRPPAATPPDTGGNPLPAPSPVLVLAMLGVAALLARRGGLR